MAPEPRVEPRPELRALAPAVHGGDAPDGVLDFSTGVSPFAPPPSILRAAREADLSRYPHPTARPLRERIAAVLDGARGADQVVAGAGSVELIWALARAFGGPGRRVLVLGPTFGEYAQAARASGAEWLELRAPAPFAGASSIDRDAALAALRASPSLAFVCRPSNPCLSSAPLALIDDLARASPSTLWVIDEAYLPMFDDVAPVSELGPRENVASLRSFTKLFALPGLRLGCLLAGAPIARAVQASLPPWNVSAPAIAAGLAALDEWSVLPALRRELARLRRALAARLAPFGAPLDGEGGPFLLYRVGDAPTFSRCILSLGCRVRDASSFGLPEHVRVGVRSEADQEMLARAWSKAS
ncbi:MAG TPA: aminotransferase class I/II-fold pyridoxal phosphate-dependent enzyme [Polyangia bacterium]|nr:aminotransferase class I/II-fold pyridoxal phosphate-dependent enzyme [Polyangia bacterium]